MTHTTEQLEPCPFCGCSASTNGGGNSVYGRFWWRVGCVGCGVYFNDQEVWDEGGHGTLDPNHPPKECFSIWNTRAPSAELIAARKRIAELEAGLTFYAESHSKNPNEGPWGISSTDYGTRARAALGDAQ